MNVASTVILCSISLLSGLLGLLVIARNVRREVNVLFLSFALAVAVWVFTNALFQAAGDAAAYAAALASYAAAALLATFLLEFSLVFTGHKASRAVWGGGFAAALLSAVPNFVATGVVNHEIITTPLLPGYALVLVIYFGWSLVLLARHRFKNTGAARVRTDIILLGVSLAMLGGVVCNLFLPLAGNYHFVQYGPAFSLIMVAAIAFAIVRHRLFDIRTIVLRSLLYIILLVILSAAYVWLVLRLGGNVLIEFGLQAYTNAFYVLVTLLLAVSFQRIKQSFDRVTNAFFFRDAYDTKEVLDEVSDTVVSTIDTIRLSKSTAKLLQTTVASRFVVVALVKNRMVSIKAQQGAWNAKEGEVLLAGLARHKQHFFVRDDLEDGEADPIAEAADKSEVAVIVPLLAGDELLGYVLFGPKQSGNIYSRQDLDLLRIACDQLSLAIQNALRFEEIKNFTHTLQQKVEEATTELREKNRRLRALDVAKDEFISMASHQLRTPLTSAKGYLAMVLDGDGGPLRPEQRKLLTEAYNSSQRMVYLISDFLNVSRIRTGKFVVEPKPVRLTDVIKTEIKQLAATAQARGVTLTYTAPSHFPTLLLDEEKTRQVIMNFIDNAIYYTPPGGIIDVSLLVTQNDITFQVKDAGIGVPKAEQHKLFTKFYRATNARQMRPDGTGIGLFLAKKVIALQGGAIIFESRAGKGSTFGFRFPRRNALPDNAVNNPAGK